MDKWCENCLSQRYALYNVQTLGIALGMGSNPYIIDKLYPDRIEPSAALFWAHGIVLVHVQ